MKYFFLILLFVFLFFACDRTGISSSQREILVKVNDRVLTRDDIERQIPKGLASEDSLLRAESLLKKRIIDLLMDEVAYKNMGDEKAEIDKLVSEYRRSLIRHRFQERIVNDRVSATLYDSEKMAYYKENKEQFVLNENLIKGLFVKVPVSAPGIDSIRKWYESTSDEALEKIEKYCFQNALIYDYFYDRWVVFDEVMEKVPQRITNQVQFLKANNRVEVSDSVFMYLLNISDCLLVGNPAPFDYVTTQIHSILVNQRKIDYLRNFGEKLYLDAMRNGKVKYVSD
jgi:hypothetical protein